MRRDVEANRHSQVHHTPEASCSATVLPPLPRRPMRLQLTVEEDRIIGPGGELPIQPGDHAVKDLLLLLLHETADVSLRRLLKTFGYSSRATYYAKRKRYLDQGLQGLLRQRPGPRRKWRRSTTVIDQIIEMRRTNRACSAAAIAERLSGMGIAISVRSVERTLEEQGLSRRA